MLTAPSRSKNLIPRLQLKQVLEIWLKIYLFLPGLILAAFYVLFWQNHWCSLVQFPFFAIFLAELFSLRENFSNICSQTSLLY